ncbi:MAG: glycerophosphodiester phosphodiesterase [Oligoflexales bacterium]
MLNIAHRGALTEAPENSMEAFQIAFNVGSERLELDTHPNFDQIPYVIHDETLDRTTQLTGEVRNSTVGELAQATLSNGEPIPTLLQVIERFAPQMEINIEIKGTEVDFIKNIVTMCEIHRHKIIISSEFLDTLTLVKKLDPLLSIACLLPCRQNNNTNEEYTMDEAMALTHAKIAHPEAKLVTTSMMETARRKGWDVFTWISRHDEEKQPEDIWEKLQNLGVHGHCTNQPRSFKRWLDSQR